MVPNPVLTISKEGEELKSYPVQGDMVIGRAEGCSIRLQDRLISRQHAVFRVVGNALQVEKKSQFAPLSVNGSECTTAVLKEGDVVGIGPYMIRFRIPGGSPPVKQQSDLLGAPISQDSPPPQNGQINDFIMNSSEGKNEIDPANIPGMDSALIPELSRIGVSQLVEEKPVDLANPQAAQKREPSISASGEVIADDAKTKIIAATKITVKLIFKPGTANFTEFDLDQDEVSIGRGKNCDIILNDKKSSRKNSIICRAGHSFLIKDLGSVNGTFVNGSKVTEKELSGDDIIKVGGVEFRFKAVSNAYAAQEKNFLSLPPEEQAEPDFQSPLAVEGQPNEWVAPDQRVGDAFESLYQTGNQPESRSGSQPAIPLDFNGVSSIPGLTGGGTQKKTLIDKFKALPRQKQIIYGGLAAALLYFLMSGDEQPTLNKKVKKETSAPTAAPSESPGNAIFSGLSPEKKRWVESQHDLAFDYYKNREYDKALDAIQKIFILVSDYKDSKDIERYAKEGKRKMEAIEEEKKKKAEELALKAKITQLEEEANQKMQNKQYEIVKDLFVQILGLDPDNAAVAKWRKEVDEYDEQLRNAARDKQVQQDINAAGWAAYQDALEVKHKRRYYAAIDAFQKILGMGVSDKKLNLLSKKRMTQCRLAILKGREPVLAAAKKAEEDGDLATAFSLYRKLTKIDPAYPAGFAGMSRIRGVLHDQAKGIYTEAILSESYSDFASAKKQFKHCMEVAPPDDIYYERAQRKLSHYFQMMEGVP